MEKMEIQNSREEIVTASEFNGYKTKKFTFFFLCSFALSIFSLGLFSYWNNFWGYFGDYGKFTTYNDRLSKVEYLIENDKFRPEAFILGSSNMFPFQVDEFEKSFGYKTFNLANYWGRMEELWSWLNFLHYDLNLRPKLILVGVEPWTFSNDVSGPYPLVDYRRRYVATPQLVKYAPDFSETSLFLSKYIDLFSFNNVTLGFSQLAGGNFFSLERQQRKSMIESGILLSDGTNISYNILEVKEFFPKDVNKTYNAIIKGNKTEDIENTREEILSRRLISRNEISIRLPGGQLDLKDFELMERLVKFCNENNTDIIFLLPPVHPHFRDFLNQEVEYQSHVDYIVEFLEGLQSRNSNILHIFDATDLSSFKGDAEYFHDITHMSPQNTNLIINEIRQRMSEN